jgi:hypothetical protein
MLARGSIGYAVFAVLIEALQHFRDNCLSPTAISPFSGAATGSGGEIRDEGATGRGSKPKAGLVGFSVSNLRLPGAIQPWEKDHGKPNRIVSALDIMIEGPLGGAAFNNEFGRPAINGYFRTFEQKVPSSQPEIRNPKLETAAPSSELRGYHKPIMLAGGIGKRVPSSEEAVELGVPERARTRDACNVVIHFHGAAWLPEQAVAALGVRTVTVVLNLGAGSGIYDRSFADPAVFDTLLATVTREVAVATGRPSRLDRVTLVGFSAGHGAVRAILREPRHMARVDAVLLLRGQRGAVD